MQAGKKILLVHLVSNGDCLYATVIARQIKSDFPGCHLTWAISDRCAHLLHKNPFIDSVWEVPCAEVIDAFGKTWSDVKKEALAKKQQGLLDEIFFTQVIPDNILQFDGTIRTSAYKNYPRKITVPPVAVVNLDDNEVKNVREYAASHQLSRYKNVVLFECAPRSNQSLMTPAFALSLSEMIVKADENTLVILSSNLKMQASSLRIVDGSELSLRENAELSKYCTHFIGCSSGITWMLQSGWAKRLPMLQLLTPGAQVWNFASVVYDQEYWNQPTDHIIEVTNFDKGYLLNCIQLMLNGRFAEARKRYHETLQPDPNSMEKIVDLALNENQFCKAFRVPLNFYKRNKNGKIFLLFPYFFAKHCVRRVYLRFKYTAREKTAVR